MATLGTFEDTAVALNNRARYGKETLASLADPQWNIPQDGTSNAGAAINSMVQAVPEGTTIEVPPRQYMIETPIILKNGVVFQGLSGQYKDNGYGGVARFKAAASMDAVVTQASSTQLYYAGIVGVQVNGANLANRGVHLLDAYWCRVQQVMVDFPLNEYIVIDAGFACTVKECFGTNGLQGTYTSDIGGVTLGGTDHYVNENEISGNNSTYTSNKSSGHQASFLIPGSNNFISDNVGEFTETGYIVTGNINRLHGNRADHQAGDGFLVTNGSNLLSCNMADTIGQAASNTYAGFHATGTGCAFTGNGVNITNSTVPKYYYQDEANGWDALHRNEWAGNAAGADYGTSLYGMVNWAGSSPTQSRHLNRPSSGATTLDANNAGVFMLDSGGAARTITAISGGANGQVIDLIPGDGNYTLSSGAANTKSGSNYALPSGQVTSLLFANGAWYQR